MNWGITDWAYLVALIIFILGFWAFVIWFLLRSGRKKPNSKPQPQKPQRDISSYKKSFDRSEYDKKYQVPKVMCPKCGGHFIIRHSDNGYFCGCSNYPKCRKTMNIYDFIEAIVSKFGVRIYAWDILCWRCKEETTVYTYDLTYDLRKAIRDPLRMGDVLTVGTLSQLDAMLAQRYPTVDNNGPYPNMCVHCRSDIPLEYSDKADDAFGAFRAEEFFWVDTIRVQDKATIRAITNAIIRLYDNYKEFYDDWKK